MHHIVLKFLLVKGDWFDLHVGDVRWKSNLATKAAEAFFQRQRMKPNLADLVYNNTSNSEILHTCRRLTFSVFRVLYLLVITMAFELTC